MTMKQRKYAKPTAYEIVQCFLLFIAVIIALFILKTLREYDQIDKIYEGIAQDTMETEEKGFPVDFDELLKINPNCVGWIQFPQKGDLAQVNYPIVHSTSANEDQYYLHHTFDRKYNFAGCIFTASWEKGDFADTTDDNTIIYGHAMNNRSMFGGVKQLRNQSFYDQNQNFYIFTPGKKIYKYHIIGVFETIDGSDAYIYQFADTPTYEKHIKSTIDLSEVKTSLGEQYEPKHMVTLSTCNNITSKGRIVAVAVRESEMSFGDWNKESNKK